MNIRKIHTKNADYQKFEVLKTNRNKRYRYGEFFVEGVRNINEAIKNNWRFSSFLYSGERPLSRWAQEILRTVQTDVDYELPSALMEELSGKEDTSELLAILKMRDDAMQFNLSGNPMLALFDRPSNRGNLGTVIRSCDAMGIEGLIVTGHSVDVYDPDTIVSSMGSFFHVPVIRMADNPAVDHFIKKMRSGYPGFRTIGSSAHAPTCLFDIDMKFPLMFFIGNETDGLCNHFTEICDVMGAIPMVTASSASSLNVACAATVLFYEAVRQRKS